MNIFFLSPVVKLTPLPSMDFSHIPRYLRNVFYEISSIVFMKEMGSWELNTKPT